MVQAFEVKGDEYGIIHGDLHLGNIHFNENQITLFDFDHCAYGWRAYDLVTSFFLPEAQRESFFKGYETLRPLTQNERTMLPIFFKLRGLWDIGDVLATQAARALP